MTNQVLINFWKYAQGRIIPVQIILYFGKKKTTKTLTLSIFI